MITSTSTAERAKAVAIIRAALDDRDYEVRSMGLLAAKRLDDLKPLVPKLQEIAEHDPFVVREPGQDDHYPARTGALELLRGVGKE